MNQRNGSPYVSPRVEGAGIQSAVGIKPFYIVSWWVSATEKGNVGIELPFVRKRTCLQTHPNCMITILFNRMLAELVKGELSTKLCWWAAIDTGCSVIFDDSPELSDIIGMFEHLKVFHAPIYVCYTENAPQLFKGFPYPLAADPMSSDWCWSWENNSWRHNWSTKDSLLNAQKEQKKNRHLPLNSHRCLLFSLTLSVGEGVNAFLVKNKLRHLLRALSHYKHDDEDKHKIFLYCLTVVEDCFGSVVTFKDYLRLTNTTSMNGELLRRRFARVDQWLWYRPKDSVCKRHDRFDLRVGVCRHKYGSRENRHERKEKRRSKLWWSIIDEKGDRR